MRKIFLTLLVFAPIISNAQAIIANPQNSTGEGGELVLKGSTSSINPWHLDNLSGNFRMFHSGTEYIRMTKDGYLGIRSTNIRERFQIGNSFTFHDGGHKVIGFMYAPGSGYDFSTSQYAAEVRFDPVAGNLRFGTSDGLGNNPTTRMTITNDGNIGVGTINPQARLEVIRGGTIGGTWNPTASFFTLSDGGSQKMIMDSNEIYSSSTLHIGSQSGDIVKFRNVQSGVGTSDRMVIKADGKIGIGTSSPTANLEISSTTAGNAVLRIEADEDNNNENDNPIIELRQDGGIVGVNMGYSSENFGENVFGIGTVFPGKDAWDTFVINSEHGGIGMGTINTNGYRLSVNGNIRATEVKVYTNWADYVFEDTYNLPTLNEVEQHIADKGHLINIPSAEEVAKEGIYLGEMNAKLLEKIEELTLYTIAQEKEILEQKEKIAQQRKEIDELKRQEARINELEEKLNSFLNASHE